MINNNTGKHIIKTFWVVFIILLVGCSPVQETQIVIAEITSADSPTIITYTPTERSPTTTPLSTPTRTQTPEPSYTHTLSPTALPSFRFVINGDMANHAGEGEMDTVQFFRGMLEHIAALPDIAFMISAGDITPPWEARWTIDRYLGQEFLWYPVVGNHEVGVNDMNYLRAYNYDPNGSTPPNIVSPGPSGCEETTFSIDFLNAHFIILNVYCDLDNDTRTDGAIVDHLYNWLQQDLDATRKEHIFVVGHEPAFPQPDAGNGIIRHLGDSLDQYPITRDRFWALLKQYQVTAYITGHTHSYSIVNIDGIWQVDVAHSMGARTQATRSTFIVIDVKGSSVSYSTYRVNNFTDEYELTYTGSLK